LGEQQNKHIKSYISLLIPWILLLFTLALISFLLIYYFKSKRQSEALLKIEKSIAVLPFINDSPDKENIYFINGIMERVLNDLQIVREFRVISRTSVEQFRNSNKPVTEIARKLGVNYIVEGSGQKYDNSFSISVQLIKASNENHLWGETYDREIYGTSDIYSVQSEIAQSIASALKATITPEEEKLINKIPTTNLTAYDFYQRGVDYLSKMNYPLALNMFSRAILEDSLYTAAYVRRAQVYIYIDQVKENDVRGYDIKAKVDIKKCITLSPDLPEVKLLKAIGYYHFDLDYENALKIIKELKTQTPNMADLYAYSSYVLRRHGRWKESLNEAKLSIDLEPFNVGYICNFSDSYQFLHQHDNQIESLKKGMLLIPDSRILNYYIFYAYLDKTSSLKIALKESGLNESDVQYWVYYYTQQYEKLRDFIKTNESEINVEYNREYIQATGQYSYHPKTYNLALTYYLGGNKPLCRIYADSAITILKEKIKQNPGDERFYATLGKCEAFIGNYREAVADGEKAVSLMPDKADALKGIIKEQDLMEIYVFIGDRDKAMNKIEYLLSTPSWLSVGKLLIDPIFSDLRSLPRFRQIISSAQKRQARN
jgi:TolB-like protein